MRVARRLSGWFIVTRLHTTLPLHHAPSTVLRLPSRHCILPHSLHDWVLHHETPHPLTAYVHSAPMPPVALSHGLLTILSIRCLNQRP
jgi:hypothetical protein